MGSEDAGVQIACAKAICASIVALEEEGSRDAFKPAIAPIVTILGAALARDDEENATSIMEYLVEIAAVHPIFFKGILDEVVAAMLTVAQSTALEFSTRSIALELMVTLSESAPALARRCAALVQGIVPLAMAIMLDVEESEEEFVASKFTPDPVEDNACTGEEALERAAAGMGGRILGAAVLGLVQQYASSADWTYRRAAVAALTRLAEGSPSAFKPHFEPTIGFLTGAMSDASARVCYQAVQTVGQFAVLFPQHMEQLVSVFVPLLTTMLGDASTCDQVRGLCAQALINLMNPDSCEEEYLTETGLLEPILQALVVCLQSASVEVQPTCLDLLARVAQVSGEAFTPYYSAFMPGIIAIINNAKGPHLLMLRGKAMHCVGIVGEAVGPEQFTPVAMEVMQLLIVDLTVSSAGDDQEIAFDYILPACARIAQALGAAFKPFLPAVMAPLLAGANQVITCVIEDANEEDEIGETIRDEEARTESGVVTLAGMKKRVTMNTYAIHQKQVSARILYEFADALKGEMCDYLPASLEAITSMITDKHSAEMREVASTTLPKLFIAAMDSVTKGTLDTGNLNVVLLAALKKLLDSLVGEVNRTSRMCSADSMAKILQSCYDSAAQQVDGSRNAATVMIRPDIATSQMLISELLKCCKESIDRRMAQEEAFQLNQGKEEEDKEAFEEEVEEEDELLHSLGDCIGVLLKLHSDTDTVMSQFDAEVVPFFGPFMSAPTAASSQFCENFQIVSSCLLDDILEFGGVSAQKYVALSVNQFLGNINSSENSVLRQCSVYGLAQIIRIHSEVLMEALSGDITPLMNCLLSVISRADAKDVDHEGATENAVFALGVLVTVPAFREVVSSMAAGSASLSQLTGMWLQGLPLKLNEPESKAASNMLMNALEQTDTVVLGGTEYSNINDILRIISEVLIQAEKLARGALREDEEEVMAHADTLQKAFAVVKSIAGGVLVPSHVAQAAFAKLKPAHQAVLEQVLAA